MNTEKTLVERIKAKPKHIIARMQERDVPKVIESTHPKFETDTRFDYGFLNVALFKDGYSVLLFPQRESDKYTLVERLDSTNSNDVLIAESVKRNAHNEPVYGRVRKTNMDCMLGRSWIHGGDLKPSLDMGEGAYLFEVKE